MIMNNFVGIFCYENFTCGTGNDEDKNQKLKNSRQKRCWKLLKLSSVENEI